MELNIKFDEKMLVETANRVLDEYEYRGKTIREWADLIANPKTNADRIRTMSDEELAELLTAVAKKSADKLCESLKSVEVDLSNCNFNILYEAHLDWVKQEVTDETNDNT